MEIHFPRYENGEKWWNPEDKGFFIKEVDYVFKITTQDEFYDEILKNINDITELVKIYTQVQEQKSFDIFKERFKGLQSHITMLVKDMPNHIKENYKQKAEPLIELLKQNITTIKIFLYENINETKKTIDRRMIEIKNKLKSARQKANHKYYLKQKELLNTEPISERGLTEEEKAFAKIEKIKESRQKANHKYYLKIKALLKPELPIEQATLPSVQAMLPSVQESRLTEEQKIEKKKEARKTYNKKYYLKNKDKTN